MLIKSEWIISDLIMGAGIHFDHITAGKPEEVDKNIRKFIWLESTSWRPKNISEYFSNVFREFFEVWALQG